MQIRRFFAVDSDTALASAKEALGEHLLVLNISTRDNGVEVIATTADSTAEHAEPFETLFSDTLKQESELQGREVRMRKSLREVGLSDSVIERLLSADNQINFSTPQMAIRDVMSTLAASVPVGDMALLEGHRRLVVHGTAGSGRTTTLAKLARFYCTHYDAQQLAVIDADPHGPVDGGILESLVEQYGVSLYRIGDMSKVPAFLERCKNKAMVMIAPPALTQLTLRQRQPLIDAELIAEPLTQLLTIPSDQPANLLRKLVDDCIPLGIDASIVTRVDRSESLGSALSISIEKSLPISFWSDGEAIDSHLYPANGRHLVEKTVAILKSQSRNEHLREEQLGDLHLLM